MSGGLLRLHHTVRYIKHISLLQIRWDQNQQTAALCAHIVIKMCLLLYSFFDLFLYIAVGSQLFFK